MASHISSDARPGRLPVGFPARKPMRRARRVSLFEREIRVRLSPSAVDILLGIAGVLSEGEVTGAGYAGSTMLTIDLTRASVHLSEACDVATARNVEVLLAHDRRVHERARAIAAREAERMAGCELHKMSIDVRVHRNGRHCQLDLNVEATLRETP